MMKNAVKRSQFNRNWNISNIKLTFFEFEGLWYKTVVQTCGININIYIVKKKTKHFVHTNLDSLRRRHSAPPILDYSSGLDDACASYNAG